MNRSIFAATALMSLVTVSTTCQAGMIHVTRAAYLGAVAGPLIGSEDFEGLALGAVPSPLPIMGGAAAVYDTAPSIVVATNTVGGPSPSQAWIASVGGTSPAGIVAALPGTFAGLGLDYAHELPGTWSFHHTGGIDTFVLATGGPPVLDMFIGWTGTGSETLLFAEYSASGVIFDNIVAHAGGVVPEPASLTLWGIGTLGLAFVRGRRRTK